MMKLTFYPREIEMFQDGEYDFSKRGCITLECRTKEYYRTFESRQELVEYLSAKGVQMKDPIYPLRVTQGRQTIFGDEVTHAVSQRGMIYGWIKEFTR